VQTRVASIYFAPVVAERLYGGPYKLPAVALGAEPAFLAIADRIQIEEGPFQLGSNGWRSKRQHLVAGEAIASDIVGEWTASGLGMTQECRPGIWVVRERVPLFQPDGTCVMDAEGRAQWRQATDKECEQMWKEDLAAARAADRAYGLMLYTKANAMAEEPKAIPYIPLTAKLAARHYGLEADWLKEGSALDVKSCPYCTKIIPAKAIKCKWCTETVDDEAYAALKAHQAAVLKAAKEFARTNVSTT
jgi:hypothetical protein